jgi:LysM repeat protein
MVRNLGRLLALLALAAVGVGIYLVIHANLNTTGSGHAANAVHHTHHHGHRHHAKKHAEPTFYTVKAGDTLSEISSRTGVSVPKLAALNPKLNPPYALQTGQRLRLRR